MNDSIKSYATADLLMLLTSAIAGKQSEDQNPSHDELQELVRYAQLPDDVIGPMHEALRAFHEAPANELHLERGRLYSAAQACPPYEAAYVRRDKGALLADIAGFYHAFSLHLDDHVHERPDHVVMELEFLTLAFVMLGNAQKDNNADAQAVCWRAIALFANEHLGEWIESFATVLSAASTDDVHPLIANALGVFWEALRARECWSKPSCPGLGPDLQNKEEHDSQWDCVGAQENICQKESKS